MTLKSILKASSIIIVMLLFSLVFFLVPKYNGQKYSPNQEREFKIKISKDNNEAQVFIYVDKKYKNDFSVNLYDNQAQRILKPYNIGEDRFTPKNKFYYVYVAEKGKTYTVKVKNKTDSTITSNIIVEDND